MAFQTGARLHSISVTGANPAAAALRLAAASTDRDAMASSGQALVAGEFPGAASRQGNRFPPPAGLRRVPNYRYLIVSTGWEACPLGISAWGRAS